MLNVLRPALSRLLTPVAEALARTPVTPNSITITGTAGVVAGALWLFPIGQLFAGTMVCTGFVLFDMLDGVLARVKGTTGPFGAFLDSTLDRIADAAVFAGLTIYLVRTRQDTLACVALFCLVAGALISYAKARAEGLGIPCDVGFAERTERMLLALVPAGLTGLGVPYVLPIGLWALSALSVVTFGQRVAAVRRGAARAEGTPVPAGPTSEEPPASRRGAATPGLRSEKPPREPKGRGGAWTEEREASEVSEGATREGAAPKAPRRRAGQQGTSEGATREGGASRRPGGEREGRA